MTESLKASLNKEAKLLSYNIKHRGEVNNIRHSQKQANYIVASIVRDIDPNE